jgi:hypothetical protein
MSMELYVFSDRQQGSIAEWQAAIEADGFNIKLDATRAFADLFGFLPVEIDGRPSGFECDHFDAGSMIDELNEEGFPVEHRWRYLLAFRFGGGYDEGTAAAVAAAVYARSTGGILFDCEEGQFYDPEAAADYARRAADPVAREDFERAMAEFLAKLPGQLPPT